MKKNYILLLLLCLCFAGCKEKTVVESDYLPIADPYVMLYDGKYYAYGTGGTVEGEGFACFSSDDLKNWTREGQALSAADSYGTWGFWAPEVYYIESKKKFYLFYSTEEHICVATADVPQGPFRQEVKQPIWDEKSIDTSLFKMEGPSATLAGLSCESSQGSPTLMHSVSVSCLMPVRSSFISATQMTLPSVKRTK